MHFTILYIMENEKLENISCWSVEDEFRDRFCYCLGETDPPTPICDWFSIGGRWEDNMIAIKGIKASGSRADEPKEGPGKRSKRFSIVEIKNLIKPIKKEEIYGVAFRDSEECISPDNNENAEQIISEWLNKINNKEIKGCVALIDCHD